jgi:ubiquitin-protein ligase
MLEGSSREQDNKTLRSLLTISFLRFDLLLPQSYPNSPPKMAFVLEGVDSEGPSMNPNLHFGGGGQCFLFIYLIIIQSSAPAFIAPLIFTFTYNQSVSNAWLVCLSILNTWSGDETQMWQPGRSTVLAVLVSIQAMILGAPLPWHNEPGFSMLDATAQANEHKFQIQTKTIKYAMTAWLMKIKRSDGKTKPDIWTDIVKEYWTHNGKKVLNIVEQWSLENPHIKSYDKANLQPTQVFPEQFEASLPVKKGPKGKTENLADKLLQEFVLLESEVRVKQNNERSSKASDGPSLTSLEDSILGTSFTTGGTSVKKGSHKGAKKDAPKGKRKESIDMAESKKHNKKGESKRQKTKTADETDQPYDSNSDNALEDLLPQAKSKLPLNDPREGVDSQNEDSTKKWVYTGARSINQIRGVCRAFGITPARSIKDSINRLEDFVNNEGKTDDELAMQHGQIGIPYNGEGAGV